MLNFFYFFTEGFDLSFDSFWKTGWFSLLTIHKKCVACVWVGFPLFYGRLIIEHVGTNSSFYSFMVIYYWLLLMHDIRVYIRKFF